MRIDDSLGVAYANLRVLVNVFRDYQRPDGTADHRAALPIANYIIDAVKGVCLLTKQHQLSDCFEHDMRRWIFSGLDTRPVFDATRDAFIPPSEGDKTPAIFIAPTLATNGPSPIGHFLETFLVVREEPSELLTLRFKYPHPGNKCQSTRIIDGSSGFFSGNCIVFFPENVCAAQKVHKQSYALFFFNKFQKIYEQITVPIASNVFSSSLGGLNTPPVSPQLNPREYYIARCVWGYLHDYFHHIGPRPLDKNLQIKLNWYAGLLEEIKVDCQTLLVALEDPEVPFGRAVAEFVIFERLLRYPTQPDAVRNFDAGTGLFLFEWLRKSGNVFIQDELTGKRSIREYELRLALRALVSAVEEIERQDDRETYMRQAKSLVMNFLASPHNEGDRLSIPAAYSAVMDSPRRVQELHFEDLLY